MILFEVGTAEINPTDVLFTEIKGQSANYILQFAILMYPTQRKSISVWLSTYGLFGIWNIALICLKKMEENINVVCQFLLKCTVSSKGTLIEGNSVRIQNTLIHDNWKKTDGVLVPIRMLLVRILLPNKVIAQFTYLEPLGDG